MPNQCYTTPIQELHSCSTTWFRCKHPNLFLKNIDARYWKGITNEIPYKTNYNKYINISLYRMYPETVPLFTCNSAFSQNLNEYIVQNWVLLLKKLKKIDHRLLLTWVYHCKFTLLHLVPEFAEHNIAADS